MLVFFLTQKKKLDFGILQKINHWRSGAYKGVVSIGNKWTVFVKQM